MKKVAIAIAAGGLLALGGAGFYRYGLSVEAAFSQPAHLTTLSSLAPIRAEFNAYADRTRLLVLLSPT